MKMEDKQYIQTPKLETLLESPKVDIEHVCLQRGFNLKTVHEATTSAKVISTSKEASYWLTAHLFSIVLFDQAYGFVELFAGAGWISRCMRNANIPTASFDIEYSRDVDPDKQDHMDLCTAAGFGYHALRKFNQFFHGGFGGLGTTGLYGFCFPEKVWKLWNSEKLTVFCPVLQPLKVSFADYTQLSDGQLHGCDRSGLQQLRNCISWNTPKGTIRSTGADNCSICQHW